MRGTWTIAAVFVAMAATPALAQSASRSTSAGTAAAAVVAPLVLTHPSSAALNFGRITSGTLGGTVIVSPTGTGSVTADVNFVPGSTVSADSFSVRGDAGRSFSVATTSGTISRGAGATLAFTTSIAASTLALNASGAATFLVGGTLTVAGNTTAGSYAGTYAVTVTYN